MLSGFTGCISLKLFDPVGGIGILVERASWWNGHLARFLPQPMQHLQKLHQDSERDAPVENFESMDDFT
ncbi:MAG: hypothetical protein F6K56_14340 [Moorea sp. SIO3G5]|nr:hypothetical protein [Moorena sp. SIO3G5]